MQRVFPQPIHIKLVPSKGILGLVCAVSIMACVILICLPVLSWVKCAMVVLVVASSAYFILRDAWLRLPWSWKALTVNSKGQLLVTNQRGQQFLPDLAETTFIQPNVVILNFKRTGFKLALPPLLVLTNQQNADQLRRLRVWLRWFKHADQGLVDDTV